MIYVILGGAGFIGSHVVAEIVAKEPQASVRVYDNFSSGRRWHLDAAIATGRVQVIESDIKDLDALTAALRGADVVYHFASNPDIAKAMKQPDVDFWEGTFLTNQVVEAMRVAGVKRILYASGSGVYGDAGTLEVNEDYSPMRPISTYGASKLAGEALLCSYCHLFGMTATAFRFANVVGPRQTHGVGYDFIRQLLSHGRELTILGDGTQTKSYLYVTDVIAAMRLAQEKLQSDFSVFNVSTGDLINVIQIAEVVEEVLGLKDVTHTFTGGNRGWKGDVPVVVLNSERIRALGWKNRFSTRQAIHESVSSLYADAQAGRFGWQS